MQHLTKNPGAVGASGASVGDMLGGNRTENTKPTVRHQALGTSRVAFHRLERPALDLDIRSLAYMLGGDVVGGQVLCPGPGHSHRDRSLSVKPEPDVSDGFLTHSFAGDDWRECQDLVRSKLHLPSWREQPRPHAIFRAPKPTPFPFDGSAASSLALRIFDEARHLHGTIGEIYLARRTGPALAWPDDLRFHPACVRKVEGMPERHPAVVALLRDIATNKPHAIQRIFLLPDGSDRLRDPQGKMCLGPTASTVAKLSPDEYVIGGLGITEGIETGLRMMSRGWRPIWATVGTSGMASFPVLDGIEALTVFADNDHNRAGEIAARQCINRWRQAGREAKGIRPHTVGQDWADVAGGKS